MIVTASAEAGAAFGAATYFQCTCDEEHAGRPTERDKGCGADWVAQPRRNQDNDRYHLEVSSQPDLNAAAKLIAEDAQTVGDGLRALGEKWIPGVGAIVGLLGLAGVVVAKDSVASLSQGWRGVAFLLVALAVLMAAGATALVYRAAFGWPKEVPLSDNDDVLAAAETLNARNADVARHVRVAVGLSGAALVALLAALGVIWLQPASDRPVTITYDDRNGEASLCGKVVEVEDAQLRLRVTDGARTTTEPVDLTSVTGLEQVTTC